MLKYLCKLQDCWKIFHIDMHHPHIAHGTHGKVALLIETTPQRLTLLHHQIKSKLTEMSHKASQIGVNVANKRHSRYVF